MTRPRRPDSRRPRPRSSTWKPGRDCSMSGELPAMQSSSSRPPSTWRPPIAIETCSTADEQIDARRVPERAGQGEGRDGGGGSASRWQHRLRCTGRCRRLRHRPPRSLTPHDVPVTRTGAMPGGPAGPDQIGPTVDTRATGSVAAARSSREADSGQVRRGPAQGGRGRGPERQVGALRRHACAG